jgi:uncharacterized protein (DUF58 family)
VLRNLQEVQEIKNIPFLAKQVVEGFTVGLHKSPFHGFSVEFAEHRVYNQGESTKNIDWKVYARTDKLYTKRYDEETNLRCQIVIDNSSSMYFPLESKIINKRNFSLLCAAGFIELFNKQRDAVGLSTFSEKLELHTRAGSSRVHLNRLYAELENLSPMKTLNKKTATVASLHAIAEQIHKRSLVIIFSDMFQNGEEAEIFNALRHLKHKKHEVILFHVVDSKQEIEFDFKNRPYLFVDLETGAEVKLHANKVKDAYVSKMKAFNQELKLKCAQYKVDFIEADINKDFSQVLRPYLLKRTKML